MANNLIEAYRVCSSQYAKPHNGYGSTLRNGGRWNTAKCACIYSGSNRSIAQLEWVSHSLVSAADFPELTMITYSVPENLIVSADLSKYPDWIENEKITKLMGDTFLAEKKYMALKVPSAIDPKEWNYIINPLHPEFSEKENVVNDTEILQLNKRFFEAKEFVKKALSMAVSAKLSRYTSETSSPHLSRTHRLGRRKR